MAFLRQRKSTEKRVAGLGRTYLWEIEYTESRYSRRSFSMGRLTQPHANEVFKHFNELLRASSVAQSPAPETLVWAESIDQKLFDRISELGLIPETVRRNTDERENLLGKFCQLYIDRMDGSSPRTKNNYGQTRTWLVKHFGEDRVLSSITREDMKRWQRSMKEHLALSNRNKHTQRAKTFFRSAVNDRLLRESPADVLKEERLPGGKAVDRSRQFFIDATITAKVLKGLQTDRWKLIFSLLRYQGLRRHEVFVLRWQDIDWQRSRMAIHSIKTGYRECPIFPEVLKLLEAEFAIAIERAEALNKTLDKSTPVVVWGKSQESLTELLRKQVARILGQENVWEKICQQLRSTRRTELDEHFPSHVVCEWLGHDEATAQKHYKQVTPEHWEKASKISRYSSVESPESQQNTGEIEGESRENLPQNFRSQQSSTPVYSSQNADFPLETSDFSSVGHDLPVPRRGVAESSRNSGKTRENEQNAGEAYRSISVCPSYLESSTAFIVLLLNADGTCTPVDSKPLSLSQAMGVASSARKSGCVLIVAPVESLELIEGGNESANPSS